MLRHAKPQTTARYMHGTPFASDECVLERFEYLTYLVEWKALQGVL